MNATEIKEMLAHIMDGIDTEDANNPDYELLFNNRLASAMEAMPNSAQFTDGKIIATKICNHFFRISKLGSGVILDEFDKAVKVGEFWSKWFGVKKPGSNGNTEPLVPNGSMKFVLIEEE